MRPDERLRISDALGIVLIKGDGTIITNAPHRITAEYLERIVEEVELDNNR